MSEQWYFLENRFQHYAWGSSTAIPELLGFKNTDSLPIAELWMGAHPSAPSMIQTSGNIIGLDTAIMNNPDYFLGSECRTRFGDSLPFLFKILSAEAPLSIQVHPNSKEAREGFLRENALSIPLDAPERNYKDPNHKPELLVALTPFVTMCGFRPIEETATLFRKTGIREFAPVIASLESEKDYKGFLSMLQSLSPSNKKQIQDALSEQLSLIPIDTLFQCDRHPLAAVRFLQEHYPDDIGVVAPLYLNTIVLEPGEGLYLPSGLLHAYLSGTGLELMANSNNVLRGGLTDKYIDFEAMISILDPLPHNPERLIPVSQKSVTCYPCIAKEFDLKVIEPESQTISLTITSPSILLVTHGDISVEGNAGKKSPIHRGTSLFLPATAGMLSVSGNGTAYIASVPIHRTMAQ